jgi:hypothetical protein
MITAAHGDHDRLERYLDVLFGRARLSTLIELRWRVPGGMGQRFVAVRDHGSLTPLIARLAPRCDVYVGVLPRWRPAGGRGAVVGDCRTVWVDLDSDSAARALQPVEPSPTVVVASGGAGHLHAYWPLRRAAPPPVIERANRRLAWALGGDLASADAARILRPPHTVNHVRGHAPVRLVAQEASGPCRLADLVGGLSDPPVSMSRQSRSRSARRAAGDPLLALAPERYVSALTGERVGRARKVHCPLHPDRTPSLHVYEDPARGWFCFGCRRGGSVYDLAGALWLTRPSSGARLRGPGFLWVRERLLRELGLERNPAAARSDGHSDRS